MILEAWRRGLLDHWEKLRTTVTFGLFGGSGALGLGGVQHFAQSCAGGGCSGCGSCVALFAASAATASAGAYSRWSAGRRRTLVAAAALAAVSVALTLVAVL